jgi:DNA processing protein
LSVAARISRFLFCWLDTFRRRAPLIDCWFDLLVKITLLRWQPTMNEPIPLPLSPPDESLAATLRLTLVSGVGPRTRKALLERFGSAEAVLCAAPSELRRVQGVGAKLTSAIVAARDEIDVDSELDLCRQHGITVLTDLHEQYPRLLREIHDPPGVLFVLGELLPCDALSIAIVGTRHATQYGQQQAERLAGGLSRAGLTIVSGLARGIDAAAHRGALAAGGRTLAVLGSGLLNIYPPEHEELAREITRHGALLSETPLRSAPHSGAFPQRNRLITGLSVGVIVVEASERSGALISAQHAMEQGREVFAVPGRVDSRTSRGCHRLIRDGAKLVESVDDVLSELGPLVEATPGDDGRVVHHPAELQLNEQERQVLDAIPSEPTTIDQVVVASRLPVQRVLATLSVLEMRRLIRRLSGNLVLRI